MNGGGKSAVVVAAAAAGFVLLVLGPLLLIGVAVAAAMTNACPGTSGGSVAAGSGPLPALNSVQSANARVIIAVTLQVVDPKLGAAPAQQAARIAVATAMQESRLVNVGYGDAAGPDSRGLFQQRAPWGPLAVRMDPAGATRLFLTGGKSPGTPGLLQVTGWQSMPLTAAAQAVQRSAFPDAYARWANLAASVVGAFVAANPAAVTAVAPAVVSAGGSSPGTSGGAVPGGDGCAGVPGTGGTASGGAGPVGSGGWADPLPAGSYSFSSPFGMRALGGVYRMHQGQDLAVPVGTPVFAAAAGTVTFAGTASGFGNLVTIAHPGGVVTYYGHLSVIGARPGPIPAGARIGLSGGAAGAPGSGDSTGPHLHFQIDDAGTPIDPVPWMRQHGAPL